MSSNDCRRLCSDHQYATPQQSLETLNSCHRVTYTDSVFDVLSPFSRECIAAMADDCCSQTVHLFCAVTLVLTASLPPPPADVPPTFQEQRCNPHNNPFFRDQMLQVGVAVHVR